MFTLRIITLALGYIAGIVAATVTQIFPPQWVTGSLMIIGLAWAVWLIYQEYRWIEHRRVLIVASVLLFALPLGWLRMTQHAAGDLTGSLAGYLEALDPAASDEPIVLELEGYISTEPELITAWRGDLILTAHRVRQRGETTWQDVTPGNLKIRWYRPWDQPEGEANTFASLFNPDAYGYQIRVTAHYLLPERPMNPGGFNYAEFLDAENILADLAITAPWARQETKGSVEILNTASGNPLMELAMDAKKSFLLTYKQTIPDPASRLVSGTTLGTRNALRQTEIEGQLVPDIFRHAGVGHVLAVSGLHVTIITILIYGMLRVTRMPNQMIAPLVIFMLILFTLLTGARPSTVRAAIMNSVILIALGYFRYGLTGATFIGLSVSSFFILLQKPMVLFGPAFLLSFGAVLSLVLITPPLDRWLLRLRGASLIGALGWFVGIFLMGCLAWPTLIQWEIVIAAFALLWLLIALGSWINQRFPLLWKVGLEKVPTVIRLFFVAQIGIQIGMMIPMSAWFFGQYPIAGVFVNLAAIPLVGVVVQLGVLTGLAGMIPGIGMPLASAFGAAATYAADLFFWIAHRSTLVTPFPVTPMPTIAWMIGYYLILGVLLFVIDRRYRLAQHRLYQWIRHPGWGRWIPASGVIMPALLILAPLILLSLNQPKIDRITLLHGEGVPILTIAGEPTVVINAGDARTGPNLIFESLRDAGAAKIDHAILAGIDPRTGIDGLTRLVERMPVHQADLAVLADPQFGYPYAIRDGYLLDKISSLDRNNRPNRWAINYLHQYDAMYRQAQQANTHLAELPTGPFIDWPGQARLEVLNDGTTIAKRYASAGRSRLLRLDYHGYRMLIITETNADVLTELIEQRPDAFAADILIISQIHISNRAIYPDIVKAALDAAQPRLVIVTDGLDQFTEEPDDALYRPRDQIRLIRTSEHGALTFAIHDDKLIISGHVAPAGADRPQTFTLEQKQ